MLFFELRDAGNQVSDVVLRIDDSLCEVFSGTEAENACDATGLGCDGDRLEKRSAASARQRYIADIRYSFSIEVLKRVLR
jgi:hypothetical protein